MMVSTSSVPITHTLMTFDSTRILRHIVPSDDKGMVDFIITNYGHALQEALRYFDADINNHMRMAYTDLYYTAAVDEEAYNSTSDIDAGKQPAWFRRTVSESGIILAKKARYDELVELCIDTFNGEIAAYIRSIQMAQSRQIYTVRVLGYENRTLKLLIGTDAPIIP